MRNQIVPHIAYWVLILAFLTIFFGFHWQSHLLAFYFSCLLLPVVMGTTYFFNLYLVPKYLLEGKYRLFLLYFFYMLVVSLYFEILVSLISFILIANSSIEVVNLQGISIFILGITLYLIVFATSFINLVSKFKIKTQALEAIKKEQHREKKNSIQIRADRKNHLILLEELKYIESLSDYVKIVTIKDEYITREKITRLQRLLPSHFIRIHRSFIINKLKVESFTMSEVIIDGNSFPISRTYKTKAIGKLQHKGI